MKGNKFISLMQKIIYIIMIFFQKSWEFFFTSVNYKLISVLYLHPVSLIVKFCRAVCFTEDMTWMDLYTLGAHWDPGTDCPRNDLNLNTLI